MESERGESILYGYLATYKWYEERIDKPSLFGEINDAIRPRKDKKSAGADKIPSEISKMSRTKWINILRNIFKEIYNNEMIDSWEIGIITYIYINAQKRRLAISDQPPS